MTQPRFRSWLLRTEQTLEDLLQMRSCFITSSFGAWHCYYEVVTFLNSAASKLHKGRTLCKVFYEMDYIPLCSVMVI